MRLHFILLFVLSFLFSFVQKNSISNFKNKNSFGSQTINLSNGEKFSRLSPDSNSRVFMCEATGPNIGTDFLIKNSREKLKVIRSISKKGINQSSLHFWFHEIVAAGDSNLAEIKLRPRKNENKWFLIQIGTNKNLLPPISGPITIQVEGDCVDEESIPIMRLEVFAYIAELYVLPQSIEIESRNHRKNKPIEQAIFSEFIITDSSGKMYKFGPGDYYLAEGKSISFNN